MSKLLVETLRPAAEAKFLSVDIDADPSPGVASGDPVRLQQVVGLAIVRHLVELHGGSVHAESAGAGHGATFRVRLPVKPLH